MCDKATRRWFSRSYYKVLVAAFATQCHFNNKAVELAYKLLNTLQHVPSTSRKRLCVYKASVKHRPTHKCVGKATRVVIEISTLMFPLDTLFEFRSTNPITSWLQVRIAQEYTDKGRVQSPIRSPKFRSL